MKKLQYLSLGFVLAIFCVTTVHAADAQKWNVQLNWPTLGLLDSSATGMTDAFATNINVASGELSIGYDLNSWFTPVLGVIVDKGPKTNDLDFSNDNEIMPEVIGQFHYRHWGWLDAYAGVGFLVAIVSGGNTYDPGAQSIPTYDMYGNPTGTVPYEVKNPMTVSSFAPLGELGIGIGPFESWTFGFEMKFTNINWNVDESKGSQNFDNGGWTPFDNSAAGPDMHSTSQLGFGSLFVRRNF